MVLVTQFIMSYVDIYVNITLIVLTSCVLAISRVRVRFARARAGLFCAWSRVLSACLQHDEAIIRPHRLAQACLMNYCVWLLWGGSRIVSANAPLFNLKCFFK